MSTTVEKVALITGAASGIGAATARRFASAEGGGEGFGYECQLIYTCTSFNSLSCVFLNVFFRKLALVDLNAGKLEEVAEECR